MNYDICVAISKPDQPVSLECLMSKRNQSAMKRNTRKTKMMRGSLIGEPIGEERHNGSESCSETSSEQSVYIQDKTH
jgi:hypothetical protein